MNKRRLFAVVAATAMGVPSSRAAASCGLQAKDEVVFFPTVAAWNAARKAWGVDIHGLVYEPAPRSKKRRVLLRLLRRSLGISPDQAEAPLFQSRAEAFFADDEDRTLTIELAGKTYTLPSSSKGGHVEARLFIPDLKPNRWTAYQTAPCGDARIFRGEVWPADDRGLMVISDIDDTIKVTGIGQIREILARTFLREYEAVPGMADLYRRWSRRPGTIFCYVSASPWPLFAPLAEFLNRSRFPDGFFYLKRFHWNNRSFWSLFKSPESYKPPLLKTLLQQFPHRKVVLVGDTGEKDPEIYGAIAREHGTQIEQIYIRQVGMTDKARLERAFQGVPPALWKTFRRAEELP